MSQAKSTFEFAILIVDDDVGVLDLVGDYVRQAGFEALCAPSVSAAIELITQHASRLVLIISDLEMPDGNGLALREAVKGKWADIPFAIFSGHISVELAMRGMELKIAAFVDKGSDLEKALHNLRVKEIEPRIQFIRERQTLEKTFISEAWTILDDVEPLILTLENNPRDSNTINTIFRLIHTLKGSSGILEDDTFFKFAHKFEDTLSQYKNGSILITPDCISAMLRGFDILKELIEAVETHSGKKFDLAALQKSIVPVAPTAAEVGVEALTQAPTADHGAGPQHSRRDDIRVPPLALDSLLELSGEITVIRNMVNKLVKAIEKSQPGNRDVTLLGELLEEMHKINGTMQSKIIDLRKSPLSTTLKPLTRTVRDLSRTLGKELDLATQGDDLRVDTAISQVLSDSLIHLIRNSADHGIETPAERQAKGKSLKGHLKIQGREERDEVVVAISDDGRGLDRERIIKKIVENGMATREQAAAMRDSDVYAKIFESGFSTAAAVSEVSGRGVGMDMVRSSVERLKGRIVIATERDKGTTFTLHLPVPKSVLIIDSLLITTLAPTAAGLSTQTFAIPQDHIVRLYRLDRDQRRSLILKLEGGRVLRTPDGILPLINLRQILIQSQNTAPGAARLKGEGAQRLDDFDANPDPDVMSIVVIQSENIDYGLVVDSIIDSEEIVVKPVGEHLAAVKAYMGATFLGDGGVGLILDVGGIAELAQFAASECEPAASESEAAPSSASLPACDYLVFNLHKPGLFAVPLAEVFRIEEIKAQDIKTAGERRVVIYRDTLMPLYDLNASMGFGPPTWAREGVVPVLVKKIGNLYFGFIMRTVVDIAITNNSLDAIVANHSGIKGNVFIGDDTAIVIDLATVLRVAGVVLPVEGRATEKEARTVGSISPSLVPPPPIDTAPPITTQNVPPPAPAEPAPAAAAGWGLFD